MSKQLIDLGNGQSVPRHHPPEHLVRALDMANAAVEQAQEGLRRWIRPLYKMQAPANFNAHIGPVNAPGMSGIEYGDVGDGQTIDVDERDVVFFKDVLKFTLVQA